MDVLDEELEDHAYTADASLPSSSRNTSASKKKLPTRRSTQLFGLGHAICDDDATITGIRLPTCSQVLHCMMFHCNAEAHDDRPGSVGASARFTTAKKVLQQVAAFYQKGNIPIVTERRACGKIVELLDANNKLRSINKDRRDSAVTQFKLQDAKRELAKTFQLWPPNVEKIIKNPQDLAFLHSMKGDRVASFGGLDKVLAGKIARRKRRDVVAAERLDRARKELQASSSTVSSEAVIPEIDGSECDDSDGGGHIFGEDTEGSDIEENGASTVVPEDGAKPGRKTATGISVFIPSNLLSRPNLVSLATRLKMTPMQQAAFTQGVITESGVDVSKIATSYATADRYRRKVVSNIATKIRDEWTPPQLCTLHWDSMLTPISHKPSCQ